MDITTSLYLGEENKKKIDNLKNLLGKNYFCHDDSQNYMTFHLLLNTLRLCNPDFVWLGSKKSVSISACIPSKIKDVNVKVPNMITGRNESKSLVKHIAYDCKCRFDGKNCKKNESKME